jgi:hypothetical protein
MRDLHELSIGQRIVLTFVIIIVILLLLAAFGWWSGGWQAEGQALPEKTPWDARMNALDQEALDGAYRAQLQHLFATWLKDSTDQPRRMTVGLAQARRAYVEAMTRIEERMK